MPVIHFLRQYPTLIESADGNLYRARAYATYEPEGVWHAWFGFFPLTEDAPILNTAPETAQTTLEAVAYWADGITAVYLEGALERARRDQLAVRFAREAELAERRAAIAHAEAEMYEQLAASAHTDEELAEIRKKEALKLARVASEGQKPRKRSPARRAG